MKNQEILCSKDIFPAFNTNNVPIIFESSELFAPYLSVAILSLIILHLIKLITISLFYPMKLEEKTKDVYANLRKENLISPFVFLIPPILYNRILTMQDILSLIHI